MRFNTCKIIIMDNLFSDGAELICKERLEQISKHGRTAKYDSENNISDQLVYAAGVMATEIYECDNPAPKGWEKDWWDKMLNKPYKERLIIAGALLAAKYDEIVYDENNVS